ncbi:MAG: AraC family transcriptional regulator [Flavobacterium sp.]
MTTITLPDELNIDKLQPVQVFNYHSLQEITKQQIILNQNIISFLIEGTKEVFFDNYALSINYSSFIIVKSGNCLMTEKLSNERNYQSVILFFTNEIVLKFIRKFELNKNDSTAYESVYTFDYNEFTKRFAYSLLDISKLSKDIQKKLLAVKFEEIMLYLTATYGTGFLYSLITNSSNVTQKFIRTIESNQLSKLTLKELAFLCDMSVSTFKREFEKHYTVSPIKWFQNKRLQHAQYLLNQEQKSPSEVYYEAGYENLSSFIQAYKSKYGVTPKHHNTNMSF